MIRLILVILVLFAAISFGIKNATQEVTLEYYFGWSTAPFPVYQLILWSFIMSVFVITLLLLPEWIRLRLTVRRQRKDIERLKDELNDIKSTAYPEEVTGSDDE
jgi:uncharacterized membrane protein YciS (DUF1049 family)